MVDKRSETTQERAEKSREFWKGQYDRTVERYDRLYAQVKTLESYKGLVERLTTQFTVKETRQPLQPVQKSLVYYGDFDSVPIESLQIALVTWLEAANDVLQQQKT